MPRPRRKPRYCRLETCGKSLRTSKTGRWFFCSDDHAAQYVEEHEPDVDPSFLLELEPLDLVEGAEPPENAVERLP